MVHRMESYSLNGTWCQSYDWLKIVGLQTAAVFVKINYTLTDVTLKFVEYEKKKLEKHTLLMSPQTKDVFKFIKVALKV